MFPAEGYSLLGHKLPKRGRSCESCKYLKIGCSGHAPCTRCWRLELRCVPQGQARGGRVDGSGSGSSGSCGGGDNGGGDRYAPLEDVDEDEKEAAKGSGDAAPDLPPPPPPGRLMRLVIERLDPRPIAELVAQTFIDRHREGLVVRDNAVRIL